MSGSGAEPREGRPGGKRGVARRECWHKACHRQWEQYTCEGQKWEERDQHGWDVITEEENGFRGVCRGTQGVCSFATMLGISDLL